MKKDFDVFVECRAAGSNNDWNAPTYRYVRMNADMDDLATFHKAMLFLKGFYQDELHKTDSAFNEHYLNKWITSLTLKIQAVEACINELEKRIEHGTI